MLASKLIDVSASNASKQKMRIRWDSKHRWYVSHSHNSYYRGYGDTIEEAYTSLVKTWRQLT